MQFLCEQQSIIIRAVGPYKEVREPKTNFTIADTWLILYQGPLESIVKMLQRISHPC